MATAASMGLSSRPVNGNRMPAATDCSIIGVLSGCYILGSKLFDGL